MKLRITILENTIKMIQEILTYLTLIIAVFYLMKKLLFKPKSKNNCKTDCGC